MINSIYTFADPTQLWLEFSTTQTQWQPQFSTPSSCWNAYLNRICLDAVLPWLREYAPQTLVWPNSTALPSFWELVNGTAIVMGTTRLVLIPSETIDLSLRVPQEWVDIPGWAADYYLAVQVNPDQGWLRIWGYTTHQQLKTSGSYDPGDRTYCLEEDGLIQDLNVLWVAPQLCPEEPTRGAIAPLPALPLVPAKNLLQRLGNSAISAPRLAVPFELWGALLQHGGWRQRLSEQRQGLPQWSILQWLQTGVSDFAQQIGWQRVDQPSLVGARGGEQTTAAPVLSRQLTIAGQLYELQILPQGNPEERIWRFELSTSLGTSIPSGFKLRLLTEDLQPFEDNEVVATTPVDRLDIGVVLKPGEGLVWEIEPIPENYDQEILHF